MWVAVLIAAVLLAADRVCKHLSRSGKWCYDGKLFRFTHVKNRGFFLNHGQQHPQLVRWLPCVVWVMAAIALVPELGKRLFAAQLGILLVLLGGISNQLDRVVRRSVTDYLQFPHRRVKKRAAVWNIADFMLLGGVVLTCIGLLRELLKK